jgi:TPR repeat protein
MAQLVAAAGARGPGAKVILSLVRGGESARVVAVTEGKRQAVGFYRKACAARDAATCDELGRMYARAGESCHRPAIDEGRGR